jgi:O-glycosyl hydrolase
MKKNVFILGLLLCAVSWYSCNDDPSQKEILIDPEEIVDPSTDDKPKDDDPKETPRDTFALAVLPENCQEVKGWGLYPGDAFPDRLVIHGWTAYNISSATEALRVIFEELGINMYRVNLDALCGTGYTASNRTLNTEYMDELVKLVQYARSKGVTEYLMTLWSPPFSMKEAYNFGTSENPGYMLRLKPENYTLFTEYVRDAILYLQERGCPPPAVLSLQNEPEFSGGDGKATAAELDETGATVSKGTHYTGTDLVNLLKKTRATLDAAGLQSVKLGAPESTSYIESKLFENLDVNSYKNTYDIHIIHSYMDVGIDNNAAFLVKDPLTKFQTLKSQLGKESWQTEFSMADENSTVMQRLMWTMQVFSSDMVHAGHTVWMWWDGWMSPTWTVNNPKQYVLLSGDGKITVDKSRMFDALAIIFNNVRPGSHVRKISTTDPALRTDLHLKNSGVAFEMANGGTFILLVNHTDKQKVYRLSGLTGQTGTLTTMEGNDAYVMKTSAFTVTADGTAEVPVPKNSVGFFITKN